MSNKEMMNWVYTLMALDLGLYLWYLSDPHNLLITTIENLPLVTGLNAFFALIAFINLPWITIITFVGSKGKQVIEEATQG